MPVYFLDDERGVVSTGNSLSDWTRWDEAHTLKTYDVLVVEAEALLGVQKTRSACGGLRELEKVLADPAQNPGGVAIVAFESWEDLLKRWEFLQPAGFLPFKRLPLTLQQLQELAEKARNLIQAKVAEWRRLRELAFEASIVSMLRPLVHGGRLDVVNKGAGATQIAIQAVREGVLEVNQLRDLLSQNPWWLDICNAVNQVERKLADAKRAGFASGQYLRQFAETLVGALSRFARFADRLQTTIPETKDGHFEPSGEFASALLAAQADLDTLMEGIGEFQRERDPMRKELLDVQAEASNSLC